MVRTTELLSFPRRVPRFATPGRPGAAAACYVALWRLPRPDFHRLVIRTFHGAPCACSTTHGYDAAFKSTRSRGFGTSMERNRPAE